MGFDGIKGSWNNWVSKFRNSINYGIINRRRNVVEDGLSLVLRCLWDIQVDISSG